MAAKIDDFELEVTCIYKNESYNVRDNGAVLRLPIRAKRLRRTDSSWTFGKLNSKSGYLEIASVRIHRIVAVAFHGEPPTEEYVVDHIDTNKQNNRPGNLRWVTRLENILLNPITAKRIELVCGSVEAFLDDPQKFRDKFQDPNYSWMCSVSKKEAQDSRERLLTWSKSNKRPSGGTLGEWIYTRGLQKPVLEKIPEFSLSLTQNALQKNWKTPTEFPCCPDTTNGTSISAYLSNLEVNKTFAKNQYSASIIEDFAFIENETVLLALCRSSDENAIKPYSLAEVTVVNERYVHNNLGSFFQKDAAQKQFMLTQGLDWTGGDTID
jgi:hypothetical protein